VVLDVYILILELGVLFFDQLVGILFQNQFLFEFSEFRFLGFCLLREFTLVLFKRCAYFLDIVELILFNLKICFPLVREFHIVPLQGFKFLVDSCLFFPVHPRFVFVLRCRPSQAIVQLLFLKMQIFLGLGQLSPD